MVDDSVFWLAMRNTAVYTLLTVFLGLGISLVLSAIIFNFKRRSIETFFKGAFYLPAVASGVALSMVWLWLFQPTYGMFNYLLSLLGIPPQLWIADPDFVMPSLIFMALAIERGAQIILLTASMGSIPESLYEAAKIDGAGRMREFFSINGTSIATNNSLSIGNRHYSRNAGFHSDFRDVERRTGLCQQNDRFSYIPHCF